MTNGKTAREEAIRLVIIDYLELQKHNPNHKLLKYFSKVEDNEIIYSEDDDILAEFVDKYIPENTPLAVTLTKYGGDLKDAVNKIKGISLEKKV